MIALDPFANWAWSLTLDRDGAFLLARRAHMQAMMACASASICENVPPAMCAINAQARVCPQALGLQTTLGFAFRYVRQDTSVICENLRVAFHPRQIAPKAMNCERVVACRNVHLVWSATDTATARLRRNAHRVPTRMLGATAIPATIVPTDSSV